jgi:hypothetical protein
MEGASKHLWEFKDKAAGAQAMAEYIARRDQGCDKIANGEFDNKVEVKEAPKADESRN